MRILRKPAVKMKTGMSGPTIDRREAAGDFPKRVQLSPRAVGWVEDEIDSWLTQRITGRDAPSVESVER
jgi:prophage regulatory protein